LRAPDDSGLLDKGEVNFNFLRTCIFEGDSQFLAALTFLYCEGDNFLVEVRELELFLADNLRDFNSSSQKNVNFLLLSNLLSVFQEFLHAVVISVLEEILKAILNTELFVSICQDANVDH